jgi:hypothetical protein
MAGTKRPFWMHQLVEYILGIVLIAQALQSETPALPAVAGGVIVLNAACSQGALAAFRVIPRRTHRIVDVVVIALVVVLAVQPWATIESGARMVMIALAAVLGFIWWQSDFSGPKPRRAATSSGAATGAGRATGATGATGTAAGDRSTDLGRVAGRAVGGGVNAVKRWTKR